VARHALPQPRGRFRRRPGARLGLPAAVDRLRNALAYNGLTLDSDARLLAGVLSGAVSGVELAEAICSARRMTLTEATGRLLMDAVYFSQFRPDTPVRARGCLN
jgi:hypothetical protein